MMSHQRQSPLLQFVGLLFQRAPMFRVALAMAFGILLGEYLPAVPIWLLCLVAVAGVGLMSSSTYLFQSNACFTLSLWLTFVAMGWLLVPLHAPADPFAGHTQLRNIALRVRLEETPRPTTRCYKVPAQVSAVAGNPTRGKLMLFIARDSLAAQLRAGDCLQLVATPRLPRGWDDNHQFNYRRYLRRHGILWQSYVAQGCWHQDTSTASPVGLRFTLLRLQQRWVEQLRSFALTSRQQAVAEALLLGWREDVDLPTQQQFRGAGIAHLLCVSGLHVGVMALLVGSLLFFLGRRRWHCIVRGVVQLVAVWFFVLLTGMAPATLRAGLMFSLMILGGMLLQRSSTLNNLATSAVIIFCCAPMQLFDVGFQLSYAALLGIVAWHRPLCALWPWLVDGRTHPARWPLYKLWQWTCLSTAAQLGTLPLALFYFHQFPTYFLIANLTIVPFAGLLLATALLTLLLGGASWVVALLRLELGAVDGLTRWVSGLPGALLEGLYCDLPMLLLMVAALFLFTLLLRGRYLWALPALLGCLLLLVLYRVVVCQ